MKRIVLVLLAASLAMPLAANPGNCPGKGDFGLTLTIPGYMGENLEALMPFYSVGFAFHFSENFFTRPRVLFNYIIDDDTTDPTERYFYIGVVLNAYLSILRTNGVTLYIGPEIKWLSSNFGDRAGEGSEIMKFTANLGIQYNFSKHFAVYADLGAGLLRYNRYSTSGDTHDFNISIFGAYAGLTIYL